jgi:hypothetical protein
MLHNNGSFSSGFLSADPLDLPLTAFTQKVKANAVTLLGVDQVVQSISEPDKIHLIEVTLKDAILHPLTKIFERFEDAATTLVIRNIVRDNNKHNHNPIFFDCL